MHKTSRDKRRLGSQPLFFLAANSMSCSIGRAVVRRRGKQNIVEGASEGNRCKPERVYVGISGGGHLVEPDAPR